MGEFSNPQLGQVVWKLFLEAPCPALPVSVCPECSGRLPLVGGESGQPSHPDADLHPETRGSFPPHLCPWAGRPSNARPPKYRIRVTSFHRVYFTFETH